MKPDDCHYKHNTDHFKTHECPCCGFVIPSLRKNMNKIGDKYIIDFSWLSYRRTIEKDYHDPYSKAEGEWDKNEEHALLNSNFQLIEKGNKRYLLNLIEKMK